MKKNRYIIKQCMDGRQEGIDISDNIRKINKRNNKNNVKNMGERNETSDKGTSNIAINTHNINENIRHNFTNKSNINSIKDINVNYTYMNEMCMNNYMNYEIENKYNIEPPSRLLPDKYPFTENSTPHNNISYDQNIHYNYNNTYDTNSGMYNNSITDTINNSLLDSINNSSSNPDPLNNTDKKRKALKKALKKYEKINKNMPGKRKKLVSTIAKMKRAIYGSVLFSKIVTVVDSSTTHVPSHKKNSKSINTNKIEKKIYYIMDKYLGDGTFGAVSRIKLLTEQQLKKVELRRSFDYTLIDDTSPTMAYKRVFENSRYQNREIQILQQLDHTNIISLFAYSYSDLKFNEQEEEEKAVEGRFANLYMEYLPYSLEIYIKNWAERIDWPSYKNMYAQCLSAVKYLHEKNICHRDLKPANILINVVNGEYIVKICDFGSAKVLGEAGNITYVVSRMYRAPECLLGYRFYTLLIDIWALGVVFLECFYSMALVKGLDDSGRLCVFSGRNGSEVLNDILLKLKPNKSDLRGMKVSNKVLLLMEHMKNQKVRSIFPEMKGSRFLREVLERSVCFNFRKRASAKELLEFEFFKDADY